MMFKAIVTGAAMLALGATAVMAQDAIADRQKAMKAVGGGIGLLVKTVKGETPFDAAAVQAVFKAHADLATKLPSLFPDNSKTGGDTAALPTVWDKKADFETASKKWATEANAAATSVKDLDGLKAVMANYPKNCGGCHETFRAKKS